MGHKSMESQQIRNIYVSPFVNGVVENVGNPDVLSEYRTYRRPADLWGAITRTHAIPPKPGRVP
jgi:hypothetical protein